MSKSFKKRPQKKAPNPEVMDMLLNKPTQIMRDRRERRSKERKNDWKKELYGDEGYTLAELLVSLFVLACASLIFLILVHFVVKFW